MINLGRWLANFLRYLNEKNVTFEDIYIHVFFISNPVAKGEGLVLAKKLGNSVSNRRAIFTKFREILHNCTYF